MRHPHWPTAADVVSAQSALRSGRDPAEPVGSAAERHQAPPQRSAAAKPQPERQLPRQKKRRW